MVGVNLIPRCTQFAQARRQRIGRWSAAAMIALAVLAVPLGIDWLQRAKAADLRAEDGQLQTQLAEIRAGLRALTSQVTQASKQLERAKALRSKRAWSAMLAMIGRCMPQQCWLTSIATDPAAPAGAEGRNAAAYRGDSNQTESSGVVIEAPRMLKIRGYAADSAAPYEFVTKLKGTDVFTGVVLERSQMEPALDGTYFRFELTCEW